MVILLSLVITSCTQPDRKTPPEGYSSCILCSGTGKKAFKFGVLKIYTDCPDCNGRGFVARLKTPSIAPLNVDDNDDDEDDSGRSHDRPSTGGGGYVQPQQRQVWVDCYDCHGTRECSYCNGDGWDISTYSDGSYNTTYKCPVCYGTGNCQHCGGTGGHYEMQFVQ